MITYLYVKQHTITGLKYFGKTYSFNPFYYVGSGKYWKSHIKKHGIQHIKTLEVWGFDDMELCKEFALDFSLKNNIVESKEWANLKVENGLDGWTAGVTHSEEARRKISNKNKGLKRTEVQKEKYKKYSLNRNEEHANKIKEANQKPLSEERRAKLVFAQNNRSQEHKDNFEKARRVGWKHTEESKKKMSESSKGIPSKFKGIPRTEEVKEKLRRPFSDERKANISKARKGQWTALQQEAHKIVTLNNIGKKRTQETKDAISKALKGKSKSKEHCENISKAKKEKFAKLKSS